jgi:hypothetical protein
MNRIESDIETEENITFKIQTYEDPEFFPTWQK